MAERHPAWVSGITDVEARLANAAMLASQSQQPADAVAGLRFRSGIRNAVGNPGGLTVGVNQVTVNPFQAVIQDPARPTLGAYVVTLDAPKVLPVTAAHPSSNRTDLVIAEIDPNDADSGFVVHVVEGALTSSTTPTPPVIANPLHLKLGQINVPAGTTNPTTTDLRQFTVAAGGIVPIRKSADLPLAPSSPAGMFAYVVDSEQLFVNKGLQWVPYRLPRGIGDSWHPVKFLNDWTNYVSASLFSPAAYTIGDDGWVRLRGMVKNTKPPLESNKPIFTLPAGYRPPYRMLFTVTTSPDANARMDVLANGQVLPGNSVSDVWVSLDGITFASTSIPTATT